MDKEELYRITVREELKRICEVMTEMLSVYVRLKGKEKLNRQEKGQVSSVEAFFKSLAETEKHASDFLKADVMNKGLETYRFIKKSKGKSFEARVKYKNYLKTYSKAHRVWILEHLN